MAEVYMEIIQGTTEFRLQSRSAVAIGKFDGIHLGHQKLLKEIIEQKKNGLTATVFTFDFSAGGFFRGEEQELTTRAEKRELLEDMGIDVLIEFPLNQKSAATEPEEFIRQYLCRQMRAACICAGEDVSFGRGGAGNRALLEQYAQSCGYQLHIIDKVQMDGSEISSTRIRSAVRAGEMESVRRMTGLPYSVSGLVEHGRELGRELDMPTANLQIPQDKLLPPAGVYYSRVLCNGERYKGITNIGCKPTVSDSARMGAETYLYDFQGDLYGKHIRVELLAFRRKERKFGSVEELKKQMQTDVKAGYHFQNESL